MVTHYPIKPEYWKQIWIRDEGALEKRLIKVSRSSQIKVVLVALGILAFFLYATSIEYLYKWFGFGAAFSLIYWLLFLSPIKTVRKEQSLRTYIEDIVYEDPQKPGVFLKNHMKEQKYAWLAFFYCWCVGFCIQLLWENWNWTVFVRQQHEWLNKLPSMIPIACILLLGVNVCFGILASSAKPKSKSGKTKKIAFYALIVVTSFLTIYIAINHAPLLNDFFNNIDVYSTKLPSNPDPDLDIPDYYINFNILTWLLAMILSGLAALTFPIIADLHQNRRLRDAVDEVYKDVLAETAENNWEYKPIEARHDREEIIKKKIRVGSAIELFVFFSMVLFGLWGLYWYWGERVGNDTVMLIGIAVLGFLLIWAIFLSPYFHYKLERGITYRGKQDNLGYVGLEDRGIGSWKKYHEVYKHDPKFRRLLMVVSGLTLLGLSGFGIQQEDVVIDLFDGIGVPAYAAVGNFCVLYMVVSALLLVYCMKILQFPDRKDSERGKKRIYSLLFFVLLAGLNIGSLGILYDNSAMITQLFTTFEWSHVLATVVMLVLLALILVILNFLWFPFFIKYEDLYESIPDLLTIVFSGIILISFWNVLTQFLLVITVDYSWEDTSPIEMRDNFNIGEFVNHVFGYQYWGWIQQLLFLGYFTWLLWKISDNKYINASLSSLMFMLFHWPNIGLMLGTAIGGFLWCMWWQKRRNLWMMGWMHGWNGALLYILTPTEFTVGPGVLN